LNHSQPLPGFCELKLEQIVLVQWLVSDNVVQVLVTHAVVEPPHSLVAVIVKIWVTKQVFVLLATVT
jgi:hypothetical protein